MAFGDGWSEFEAQAGPILAAEMALQAPVGDSALDPDSGTLQGSMDWQDQDSVLQIYSSDTRAADYGGLPGLIIRGTSPHGIDPVSASVLAFIGSGGDQVFARHVDHPGTAPNAFHLRAWDSQRQTILTLFRNTVPHSVLSQLNPWRQRVLE